MFTIELTLNPIRRESEVKLPLRDFAFALSPRYCPWIGDEAGLMVSYLATILYTDFSENPGSAIVRFLKDLMPQKDSSNIKS